MVRQSPGTLSRVMVSFFFLTVIALMPMALLFSAQGFHVISAKRPIETAEAVSGSGYAGDALLAGLIVVSIAIAAVAVVAASTARSLRLERG